ncbi:MAG TPA: carbon-nitrogen family hydrolase [Gemmataceae bacterium]|jgi:predicted amidohydrolase|nr:carbon-nitrogen family hydrolase [Gemmataceae bacterium]
MRVSSVQLAVRDRPKAETLGHVLALLEATRGSDLVLLPELWPCGFFAFERYAIDAEPIDGPIVTTLRAKARDLRTHLLTGSFVERDGEDLFNTTLLLNPDGDILARYRKIHLFGYGSEEKRRLRAGTGVTVVPTPWGRAGFAICYDLRFPELFRRMADQGVDFFLVTSAWPRPREEAWILFNKARAVENMAYLLSCNCAGEQAGRRFVGRSMIVDPGGQVLAEGGADEEIVTAQIDPARVAGLRNELPFLRDRVLN